MMLVTYLIIGFLMLTLLSQYHTLQFVDARPTERCDAEVCHITITKEGFEPKTMMVRIGATVVWTNDDEGRHTVTSGSAREITTPLKSSLLESGDTYEFTFLHGGLYEGSYKYFDQATLGTGEIIVELEHAVMGKEEAFHFRQCRELITQGNYEDALFYCDEVLKLNPSNIEALNSKATALILLKKYNLSIMAFDKTLDLDPGNAKALAGKGFSLIALEKNEEGMAHIMTAFELEPENEYVLMAQVLSFEK
ncbi:MAG: tetratricopeptide repeat protein, partial [Nitrososphaerales archaeon]